MRPRARVPRRWHAGPGAAAPRTPTPAAPRRRAGRRRGRASRRPGRPRQPHGRAQAGVVARAHDHLPVRAVRVRQRLRHREHGARGHAGAHQGVAQRAAVVAGDGRLDGAPQCIAVREARGVGREALVLRQALQPHVAAEAPELPVVEDADEQLAVARAKLVVGRDVGVGAAQQPGAFLRGEPVRRVRQQQAERRVVQRRLHALPLAGARPRQQRHEDRRQRHVAGEVVHHRDAHAGRARGGVAVDAHHPAQGLQHGVVAGQAAQRPVGAEAGHAAVHEARVGRGQRLLVAQAPAIHGAGQEVLDEHVGALQQPVQHLLPAGRGQVQADGALAPVEGREVGRVAVQVERRAELAGLVPAGRLHLDDLRAMVGQHLGAQRAREHAGQVHHLQAVQRSAHFSLAKAGRPCRRPRPTVRRPGCGPPARSRPCAGRSR